MFETLNEFKLKSCQLQSFITFRDLQLSFWKFLHPRLFTKFEVHFGVCHGHTAKHKAQGFAVCLDLAHRKPFFIFLFPFIFVLFVSFFFYSSKLITMHFEYTYQIHSTIYIFNSSTHIIALSYAVIDQNSIYINSIIALDTLKLSSGSKKLPKFYTKQYIFSIGYRKFFEVKPKFDRHFHSKPNRILLTSLILLHRYFHL